MQTFPRCRSKSNEELCSWFKTSRGSKGLHGMKNDQLNRKLIVWTVALAAVLFIAYMSWDYWFLRKPQNTLLSKRDGNAPFHMSSSNVLFEVGSGSYISLTPVAPLREAAEIRIVLDDPDIVHIPIHSFTIDALTTPRNYFIPLHSKQVAGHCILSFKTSSKLPELENLFKVRIQIKVVHHVAFGYMSIIIGWMYFCFWSTCYYPQIYQNFKRKSVVGFSFDYLALNLTGHTCYFVFNFAMYFNNSIQREFTQIHPKGELPVRTNDILFSTHAVAMNIIFVIQCLIYEKADQKVSMPMITLVGGLWCTVFSTLICGIMEKISWLQFIYYLSYIKLGTTPLKCTPQVYMNYSRQCTDGWSIQGVMLDMGGGLSSFTQMVIDAINNDDLDGTLGNPGKLGLACTAFFYDIIFVFQHFFLYGTGRKRKLTERTEENENFLEKLDQLKANLPQKSKVKQQFYIPQIIDV